MDEQLRIAVCGAGAWGTAMAIHLERSGCAVSLIARREEQAQAMRTSRENADYLPSVFLSDRIRITSSIAEGLEGARVVFLASPSYALRAWCDRISEAIPSRKGALLFVSLAKGLELETRQTPCDIASRAFPNHFVGCLSGPTFAGEVAAGMPTAMTLAVDRPTELTQLLQVSASGDNMRIYSSDDLKGVELGGCMKNVYAVAAGCCQGLGLGDNALAALLTRAIAEMVRVGQRLGSRLETFYGLSGFGDLVATCHGQWSRNRSFGEAIAKGRSAEEIIASQKTAVEGYRTARSFHEECREHGIEAPILEQVYKILYERKPPMEALGALMRRELKSE